MLLDSESRGRWKKVIRETLSNVSEFLSVMYHMLFPTSLCCLFMELLFLARFLLLFKLVFTIQHVEIQVVCLGTCCHLLDFLKGTLNALVSCVRNTNYICILKKNCKIFVCKKLYFLGTSLAKKYLDGPEESQGHHQLASPFEGGRIAIFPWTRKSILEIHRRIFLTSYPLDGSLEEEPVMEMGNKTADRVPKAKRGRVYCTFLEAGKFFPTVLVAYICL